MRLGRREILRKIVAVHHQVAVNGEGQVLASAGCRCYTQPGSAVARRVDGLPNPGGDPGNSARDPTRPLTLRMHPLDARHREARSRGKMRARATAGCVGAVSVPRERAGSRSSAEHRLIEEEAKPSASEDDPQYEIKMTRPITSKPIRAVP